MEMKAEGKYVARGLSFKDAEFMEVEAVLQPEQTRMYNEAVQLWRRLKRYLEAVESVTPPPASGHGRGRGRAKAEAEMEEAEEAGPGGGGGGGGGGVVGGRGG